MRISKEMEAALSEQFNREYFSAYLYLSMANWFEDKSLIGFGHWYLQQYNEERKHAFRIRKYILDRGGKVNLKEIREPKMSFTSSLVIFEEALKHEVYIEDSLNAVKALAIEEGDYHTITMLNWFDNEQVEEWEKFARIRDRLAIIGDSGVGMIEMDKEMSERPKVTL